MGLDYIGPVRRRPYFRGLMSGQVVGGDQELAYNTGIIQEGSEAGGSQNTGKNCDETYWIIDETADGINVTFVFYVTGTPTKTKIKGRWEGSNGEDLSVQAWNTSTSTWDEVATISEGTEDNTYEADLGADYTVNDTVHVRVFRETGVNDRLYLDCATVIAGGTTDPPTFTWDGSIDREEKAGTKSRYVWDGFGYIGYGEWRVNAGVGFPLIRTHIDLQTDKAEGTYDILIYSRYDSSMPQANYTAGGGPGRPVKQWNGPASGVGDHGGTQLADDGDWLVWDSQVTVDENGEFGLGYDFGHEGRWVHQPPDRIIITWEFKIKEFDGEVLS